MKTIAISLSPNASGADIRTALRELLMPWRWQRGPLPARVEEWFKTYLPVAHAVTFDSGRSAMLAILQALGIGDGDEVLLQAYTCVAVPNSVLWNGARPRYVDIAPTGFNMDVADLARKITPRAKAILVQHTFGHPAPLREILAVARAHGLAVIEDCAHAIGATYDGQPVGTFGDAAFFSFGRDKVVSSVFGGVAVTNDAARGARLEEIRDALPFPSRGWIAQQLLHPVAFGAIVPLYYRFGLGKVLLVALQRLHLLSRAVEPEERQGKRPAVHPTRFPNALAALALRQLAQLDALNAHRRAISRVYDAALAETPIAPPGTEGGGDIFLRYTIQVPDPGRLHRAARARHILLGDWYDVPIAPKGTDVEAVGYTPGECPQAERVAEHSINLPTHRTVTEADAKEIAKLVVKEMGTMDGI